MEDREAGELARDRLGVTHGTGTRRTPSLARRVGVPAAFAAGIPDDESG
jgi:hypothetical protein